MRNLLVLFLLGLLVTVVVRADFEVDDDEDDGIVEEEPEDTAPVVVEKVD